MKLDLCNNQREKQDLDDWRILRSSVLILKSLKYLLLIRKESTDEVINVS